MAKPTKRKVPGGRVTPKGTQPEAAGTPYVAPVAKYDKPSPPWVPVLMFGLLLVGIILILLNYATTLLPSSPSNVWLLVGLGCILGGIITATQYR